MPYAELDRNALKLEPLSARKNKVKIEEKKVNVTDTPGVLSDITHAVIKETAQRIRAARLADRPVIMAFGAHTIKNGLAPVLIKLMESGILTHLATNGAGIIHDWEFSFQGESSEDVRENVDKGRFGVWEETGFYINLAIVVGAYEGRGYGESVGTMVDADGLNIPTEETLISEITESLGTDAEHAAASADLLGIVRRFNIPSGKMEIKHRFKPYGVQAAAYRLGVPFTGHPMIGHDIIYNHPANHGGAIGRAAGRDFLRFAESVSRLENGVYLSIGSAVMSPMVFEKSLSMSQNLAIQRGEHIDNHFIAVIDLAESKWDWSKGEPPMDNPDYYLRYCKSFNRMGGTMRYATADNRDFLLTLCRELGVV